jgi:beta-N-acetylhexosaminidase
VGDVENNFYPLLVGFVGTSPEDEGVQELHRALEKGLAVGVIFFRHNMETPDQIRLLTASFRALKTPEPLLLALDQEGGRVQRLGAQNGFKNFPCALDVAQMTYGAAACLYKDFAIQVKDTGFNYVLGPVVDLHHPDSQAIGALERAYSADPWKSTDYARLFIQAHRDQGIATSIKHFPGHGFARGDTHRGLVEITHTFQDEEFIPFQLLVKEKMADSVMVAHVHHKGLDPDYPASLSPHIVEKILRDDWGYDGVVVTDDLHMGAIVDTFKDPIFVGAKAALAGNDLLLFSNNKLAAQGQEGIQHMTLAHLQEGIKQMLGEDYAQICARAKNRVLKMNQTLWRD